MAEETYGFDQARVRLEEIAAQVKRKDTSLEKSLDLLEEGVRLANQCTEQIDHTQWRSVVEAPADTAVMPADTASANEADATGQEPEADADDAGPAASGAADDGDEPRDAEDPAEPAGAPPYDQATDL